jgi:hypothetical protein
VADQSLHTDGLPIETILNVVVVMFVGMWVLQAMGIYGGRYQAIGYRVERTLQVVRHSEPASI